LETKREEGSLNGERGRGGMREERERVKEGGREIRRKTIVYIG
jgi:hypothetical protein